MTTTEDKIIAAIRRLDDEPEADTLGGVLADMTRQQSFFLRLFPILGMLIFLALGIVSAILFFRSQDTKEWIAYATLFMAALIVMAILKLWLYLVWVRNSLMREIKRMELRLLAAKNQETTS
jgi:uncharacterized membrane protein YcjF (UPF0283 family)